MPPGRGIMHPGGGLWVEEHTMTWGDVTSAHHELQRLSGYGFDSPRDRVLATWEADLTRSQCAAVLRASPGALCRVCWARSCWRCGQAVVQGEERHPMDAHCRWLCRACCEVMDVVVGDDDE